MSARKKTTDINVSVIYGNYRLSLIKERKTLKMSGKDAGALLGISQSAFSRLESGKSELSLRQYLTLYRAYKTFYNGKVDCDAEG